MKKLFDLRSYDATYKLRYIIRAIMHKAHLARHRIADAFTGLKKRKIRKDRRKISALIYAAFFA